MTWFSLSEIKRNKDGIMTVLGGFLMHLTLGNLYSFGNIMTYMDSYMHVRVDKSVTYVNFIWVNAATTTSQGLFMILGGLMEKKLGPRLTCFVGSLILSSGIALTYFSIKHSFAAVILTYGLVAGLGIAIAYAVPLSCCMKWFPKRKGLVTGIVVGGFGLGSFLTTLIQTHYINPNNIPIDPDSGYFENPVVLDRVPSVFLLLGGLFFTVQIFSCFLIKFKSSCDISQETNEENRLLFSADEGRSQNSSGPMSDPRIYGRDLSVKEAVKTKVFGVLWFIFLFNCIAIGYINAMYKSFGQMFVKSDLFLSRVGAFSAIFNFSGRLGWGRLMDITSFKTSMIAMTLLLSSMFLSLPSTPYIGKYGFALWIWGIFFCFSGTFVLISTVAEKAFGSTNYSSIYGLIFTQQLFSSILLACINHFLLNYGYDICFIIIGFIIFGSTIFTTTLPSSL